MPDPLLAPAPGAPPTTTPDPNDRVAALERQLAAQAQQFTQLITQVQQFAQNVNQRLAAAPPPAPDPAAPGDADAVLNSLVADPSKYIGEAIARVLPAAMGEWYKTNVGPMQSIHLHERSQAIIDKTRAETDRKFGAGAFDAIIKPQLDSALDNLGNQKTVAASSEIAVKQMIDNIVGANFDTLAERRAAETARAAEATKQQQPPFLLNGAGYPIPPKGTLTPQETELAQKGKYSSGIDLTKYTPPGSDKPIDIVTVRDALGANVARSNEVSGIDMAAFSKYTESQSPPKP